MNINATDEAFIRATRLTVQGGACATATTTSATSNTANLERLLAMLLMACSEEQAETAKERIENDQQAIHRQHETQMAKLQESLDDTADAEAARAVSRLMSWVFTALSVIVAGAACVATGGVAVPAVVGAIASVAMLALNESGASEEIANALTDKIQEAFDCSKTDAKIASQAILTAVVLAASIGMVACGGIGGATSLAKRSFTVSAQIAKSVQKITTIANGVLGAAATGTQGYVSVKQYEAKIAQADATEISNFITELNRLLEEEKETLEQLLAEYQASASSLSGMIEQDSQTQKCLLANLAAHI